jgi:sigma-B regulation protein RsbU (phosphoserine phosphatase)
LHTSRTDLRTSQIDDIGSLVQGLDATLKREIHLAQNIQAKLLNGEKPKLTNGEVSGVSIPARLIGGDYFDFYTLPDGKIRIIIGDVMGKGIPAAMLMILTRGAFRTAAESTSGPGETLRAMNNALYADLRKLGSFVTLTCADWDPMHCLFTYASAGHCLPVIIRDHSYAVQTIEVKGIMLGGLPNQRYKEVQTRLRHDDLVFFYTDGIVEARNKEGEMFKTDRMVDALIEDAHLNVGELEQRLISRIQSFSDGCDQKDDITMVSLKVGTNKT